MKPKLIIILCIPALAFAGPPYRHGASGQSGVSRGQGMQNCLRQADCPLTSVAITTPTSLPAAELISAFEEERVAYDLYTAAAERWHLRVFSNIAAAEVRHAAALTQLANSSGIPLPPVQRGVYATAEHQRLHDQLLAIVNDSAVGALKAGALVEETDIADLRRLAAIATDPATRTILSNLERASVNHLRAFVRNLRVRGITYEPRVLTPEEYRAIAG
jgi:hypothetical protein